MIKLLRNIRKYKLLDSTKYIERPSRYFSLSEKQVNQMEDFSKENGGINKVIFTPTPIGYGVEIEGRNGISINITDFETW